MSEDKEKKKRQDIWFPYGLLKRVDEYKNRNGIATRTAAILELVRKALDIEKT